VEDRVYGLVEASKLNAGQSQVDNWYELVRCVGREHIVWLREIWDRFELQQEPIEDEEGGIVAEPLFWFEGGGGRFACFVEDVADRVRFMLEEMGFVVVWPGERPWGDESASSLKRRDPSQDRK